MCYVIEYRRAVIDGCLSNFPLFWKEEEKHKWILEFIAWASCFTVGLLKISFGYMMLYENSACYRLCYNSDCLFSSCNQLKTVVTTRWNCQWSPILVSVSFFTSYAPSLLLMLRTAPNSPVFLSQMPVTRVPLSSLLYMWSKRMYSISGW